MARFDVVLVPDEVMDVSLNEDERFRTGFGEFFGGGVSNYNDLKNKPSINEHVLVGGDNSLEQLGIGKSNNMAINKMFQ